MTALRTQWGQLFAALLAVLVMELVVKLMPTLLVASARELILRDVLLISWPVALLAWLLKFGPVSAATMGVIRPRWRTLGWGLSCFLALALVSAAMILGMRSLGVSQNSDVLASMGARPIWMLMLIAMTAAISEELIFRGIVLNYLARASGREWVGALGSLTIFALAHLSGWGWSQVIFAAAPGAVLTLFFLWKRDLGICMIGHFLIDALGLLGAYAQAHSP